MEGYKMSSHDGNTGESNQTTCLRQHAWKGTVFYVGSVNYNKDGGGSFSFKSLSNVAGKIFVFISSKKSNPPQ